MGFSKGTGGRVLEWVAISFSSTSFPPWMCRLPCERTEAKSWTQCLMRRSFVPLWHHTPVFLPGESHGWRSLVGYSPRGRKELDMTERPHFHFSLSCIGEGNGNPLQCSCLENPRDRGAWWAAISGISQSQTRLK